jgi:hypothetical protein
MAGTKRWVAPNKTAETMDAKYRSWSGRRRMDEAERLVFEGGLSQSEAARRLGVSRPRLNERVKARRAKLDEAQERASEARREAVSAVGGAGPSAPDEVAPAQPEEEPDFDVHEVVERAWAEAEAELRQPEVKAPALGIDEKRRVGTAVEFIERYFGNVVCPDCDVHHTVPDFHKKIITSATDPAIRRLLVNVAPYHAKSTIVTVYSTLYELVRNPNSRTAIVSKAGDLGEAFLYQIKTFLEDPDAYGDGPNLIDDWGPFVGSVWAQDRIYIANRRSTEKDPSVSVYGYGKQIYGRRFDRMIFDDLADLENQRNPELVAQMLAKTTQEYASRVGKTGKLIFVGTRVSPGDIYSYLDDLPAYNVVRFPCIIDEETGRTLWPEHFPFTAAIEQRQSMPTLEQFQLVYQNIDSPGLGASFPPEVLEKAHDHERVLGHHESGTWRFVLGVDPGGANSQAGYTAMIVLAVDIGTGKRYLVDIMNHKQMKAPQIKDQIIEFCERYPVAEVRVEVNGLQSQLFQYDTELVQKLTARGVRMVPHITHGRNKWDPQFGVESMAPLFYNGMISTPWGDVASRAKFKTLDEQLMLFPMGQYSDLVMAFWFAELGAREIFQRMALPAFDPRMKVPPRIKRRRHVVDFGAREIRGATLEEQLGGHLFGENRERQYVNMPGGVRVLG